MAQRGPSRATAGDTLAFALHVALPTLGKGVLIRRRSVLALADRMDTDARAVRTLTRLRSTYGNRPLQLKLPGRPRVVILSPEDAMEVLDNTSTPFMAASDDKQSALAHFEPGVSLASRGAERCDRRSFNEQVLASEEVSHPCAAAFETIIDDELGPLLLPPDGQLDWDTFSEAWFRVVRRVVLGEGARDDKTLTRQLAGLRKAANWAFLRPRRKRLLKAFYARLDTHLERAEPGSLASRVAASASPGDAPAHQVAHWLFAYDPAGMAVFRTLALLCADPEAYERARKERATENLGFMRACMMESLRLWPTTPAILRQTSENADLNGCAIAKGSGVIIFAPFFHRGPSAGDIAHRFTPDIWQDGQTVDQRGVFPFSAGPARCPARHLVLMTSAMALRRLIEQQWREESGAIPAGGDIPATLSPYRLIFQLR
ncbi:cytochrome P450 [Glycocaulis sp.]|uniref:cytochrome P450 n=1 Tax=Glycocaulis sp. TaxID=1969725 RepID=UPI003D196F6D